ncbi:pleckstrin homology domain-containing family N member 1 [Rhinatrema bivittatum]|uniref:pleckstrin homology domain-containing family N member 1 n=1 Tax=Rhinatrema bivittatum TaxID=194408 RepID=UPI00112E97E2|nr:pleckstrin homology domain-containing family N member 1 [Rhinatrema bivittatum]
MGNLACVPQPRRGQRYSFTRKSSGHGAEPDNRKKWMYLYGKEAEQDRACSSEKILHYIPGKDLMNREAQKENLDQRFLSIFRKGRKKTVVRNLGQMIHYAKVKFKFQHCQEVTDCYLELFQSFLYFQSRSQNGLTYQGLLPLKELSISKLETSSALEQDYAFRITGPLLNPLIVYCPTQQDLQKWLYHLEKQIQLNGGNVAASLPLESSSREKAELRWSVQNLPVQEWEGTQRESLGDVTCVSKVKLQHLPFQEQHERLLILYPSTLVILSEEQNSLYFKGELPLNAIRVTEDKEKWKRSFLLEGTLINTIRVTCSSQEDYQEWLECLRTSKLQNRDSSLSGSGSFPGSRLAHNGQLPGSERSSLGSEGRASSCTSAGKMPSSCRHTHNPGSLSNRQSFAFLPDQHLPEDPLSPGYTQPIHCITDPGLSTDLKRGGSKRGSKGRCGLTIQLPPSHTIPDPNRNSYSLIPEHPREGLLSPLYNEPYQPATKPQQEELHHLNRWSLAESRHSAGLVTSEKVPVMAAPKSPLYADPYTPTAPDPAAASFLQEILRNQCQLRLEPSTSLAFSANPVSHPLLSSNQQTEGAATQRYHEPNPSAQFQPGPPDKDFYQKNVSCLRGDSPGLQNLPGLLIESSLGPAYNANLRLDSSEHDYAELQSFQSDFSYDNVWDNEPKETEISRFSPIRNRRFCYRQGQEPKAHQLTYFC